VGQHGPWCGLAALCWGFFADDGRKTDISVIFRDAQVNRLRYIGVDPGGGGLYPPQ
jgi:hypothetical protein